MSNTIDTSADHPHFEKYRYDPSMAAAVIFIVLFTFTRALHYQMIRTRTWFLVPLCIGGLCDITGYIGRAISASQTYGEWTLGPYIMQSTLLLVAPALFAASIYMTWLTKIFVSGDVISFMTQAAGAGLMASDDSHQVKTGKNIVVAGLFVQIAFFGLFIVVASIFHLRLHNGPTALASVVPWRRHMHSLYAVSGLIFVRSIVRVAEFIQGFQGYLISHEVFLYMFDGTLMF